jgi:hypothetical protein
MKPIWKTIAVGAAFLAVWCLAAFSQDTPPCKGDGFVHLHGTVQEASTNENVLHFRFTGRLQFAFFTAPAGDSARKRVSLDFDVKRVPISIPKFGKAEYDSKSDPFVVSFKNAVQHALLASQSGEPVSIGLFRPKLSYATDGTIDRIEGGSGQILADRLVRELHGEHKP